MTHLQRSGELPTHGAQMFVVANAVDFDTRLREWGAEDEIAGG